MVSLITDPRVSPNRWWNGVAAQAVKALGTIDPRNGRRLAMLMDGEPSNAGHHPELLGFVGKHGDTAVNFLWQNKGLIGGGAALTAFLAAPVKILFSMLKK